MWLLNRKYVCMYEWVLSTFIELLFRSIEILVIVFVDFIVLVLALFLLLWLPDTALHRFVLLLTHLALVLLRKRPLGHLLFLHGFLRLTLLRLVIFCLILLMIIFLDFHWLVKLILRFILLDHLLLHRLVVCELILWLSLRFLFLLRRLLEASVTLLVLVLFIDHFVLNVSRAIVFLSVTWTFLLVVFKV